MVSIGLCAAVDVYASALAQQVEPSPTGPFAVPHLKGKLPTRAQPAPRDVRRLPMAQLSITTANILPPASRGNSYRQALIATGGDAPYAWSVMRGRLPVGLTLSSAGVVSGIPNTSGEFTITVRVTDSKRRVTTKILALAVGAQVTAPLPKTITTRQMTMTGLGPAVMTLPKTITTDELRMTGVED
ncbi:MAG: hypothetical protein C3F17_12190 [Bradyrhizobiaceae bacterium]|nr:MAG: hypothetical protein C3F17_12190 [Bradyrhizobiaceae bacterium]